MSNTRKAKKFFKVDFKPMNFQSKRQFSEVLRTEDWKEIIWYNVKSNSSYQHNNHCFLGKKSVMYVHISSTQMTGPV